MMLYSVTFFNKARPTPTKEVMVEAETALQAIAKAKSEHPDYTEVKGCALMRVNY